MIKLEIVSVRPLDKKKVYQFYNSDLGIKEYIKTNFKDTNKLIGVNTTISEDYTTETKVLIFKSQKDYDDFVNDEILQYQENVIRFKYNKYHGITSTTKITEI